ncbi:MAG TPA: alpha/beta hydrolase [Acidimicrobiales bacterium]|jgi:pimeloyl-ACP methyl ester carboxylesterase|nr:alpha/beta hydrolase [Acidimicrobiales bacterium]
MQAGDESPTGQATLEWSPLANGPSSISYREFGAGPCLLILHGGWGYQAYPFAAQIRLLADHYRIVIPDRSGYGSSTPIDQLGRDFHGRAMLEMLAFLDQLDVHEAIWWGHSDGAVIAAHAGMKHPERCRALILEALHFSPTKPHSREFFQRMASNPDSFGTGLAARLGDEHGADRWRRVLELDGQAWLDIAAAAGSDADLYEGRLGTIGAPTLLLHGEADPRSEPGELEAIRAALPNAVVDLYPQAGHSPHSEPLTAEVTSQSALRFLQSLSS